MKAKTLLWLVGGGVAAYVAYRWWKSRQGGPSSPQVYRGPIPGGATMRGGMVATNTTGGYVPGRSEAEKAALRARNAAIRNDPRYTTPQQTPEMPDAGGSISGYDDGASSFN